MPATTSGDAENKNRPSSKEHPYTNALIRASSPYLLQHAHNPVNWYPWDEEALDKARAENKPLIISIGYSACHWCHVMEHESYSDTAVADYMNAHFVSIKVDREERPDVDQIYMDASRLLTGGGGWPLNAFALPGGKPFYAVTYLPRAQWLELLHQVVQACREQPDQVKEQAESLTRGIQGPGLITKPADTSKEKATAVYRQLFDRVKPSVDLAEGGFGRAPKFPMPQAWELLLQYHSLTGDERALDAVTITLDRMARGGIYDQLGGGFARYATDNRWQVPHFEKMLYDNGQLVSLYAKAYQVTRRPLYAAVVRQSLEFIRREMTDENGGFYSSLNADSEGEEGRFYAWTADEIDALPEEEQAALVKAYYQVTAAGNWEQHKNILYCNEEKAAFAARHHMTEDALDAVLEKAKQLLFNARAKRVRPSTDGKILTSWNALMLKGYVDAYRALGDEEYRAAALKNAGFLSRKMINSDGGLWRNYMDGKTAIRGLLDDYAFLADAYIALYQVTFDLQWLNKADELAACARRRFRDPHDGLFFYTAGDAKDLVARKKETEDNVLPSSNSVMAHVLYGLGIYFDRPSYLSEARDMLGLVMEQILSAVPYFSNWARLLGLLQKGPYEVAVVGKDALKMAGEMQRRYLPAALFMGGEKEDLPLLEGKLVQDNTMIYVCKDKVCQLPVTEAAAALEQIA